MRRREFLRSGAALAIAAPAIGRPGAGAAPIRTITYNVLACRGYNGSRDNRAPVERMRHQIPERIALELALYRPDIVTFQESPGETVVADIAQRLGMHHAYFPGGFPGALLSCFPITESVNCPLAEGDRPADCFTRHWGRATLDTGDGKLVVYSAHLHPGGEPDIRLREIPLAIDVMRRDLESGRDMILQGDLNHAPDTREHALWTEAGLTDAFVAAGSGPPLTFSSTDRRWRIDYVWAHGAIADRLQSCRTLDEGAFRTNTEDPSSVALSDHLPVMAEFGG